MDLHADIIAKQFIPAHPLDYRLDSNATYIISGGLGGIGKSVASWMCEDGAKNLVLLSRSGGTKNQASRELIADLEAKGVCVYSPKCDVSNAKDVQDVITHINRTMPPIKGLIHASTAMVVSCHVSPKTVESSKMCMEY